MAHIEHNATVQQESVLATNKVLKNTYMLLSMTLLFSAVAAMAAMALNVPRGAALIMSLAAIGIVWFVLPRTYNKASGIVWAFAFTGLLGASLGPMLSMYLALPNGASYVAQALGGTAIITFGLSFYALTTKKDFSFLGGFIMVGVLVLIVGMIANLFFGSALGSVMISGGVVLVMSLAILFDTSRIINGGETNYIRATVSLYLDIYNIFVHLLHLIAVFSGND
ncbi:Bax inhibitor-1/YccA family protein [Reinekea marina]|uniref:Bax inhibitor-1/YccA family protein n=2 Tax=Reinekea marina TaxID=1310421 RepID=A0ABV7WN41_9GAMM|nr:Bax inhibitor-1/YccA family protein [Reinekea marina]MBU2863245.1 Bax inhibitor-1/YccA family protein [Reinekea forsetii]MDN3649459.1 Bax inhibitor-1/YccA family protein [Reinekea marina]